MSTRFAGFAPTLFSEFGDLACVATERQLHAMPVRVALLLHDSLIVTLGRFPAGRGCRPNLKRPNVISANECCRE